MIGLGQARPGQEDFIVDAVSEIQKNKHFQLKTAFLSILRMKHMFRGTKEPFLESFLLSIHRIFFSRGY